MAKIKKKLTSAQKKAKAEMKKNYKFIFINGKQVRVKKTPTIEGIDIDDYINQNADPMWLHQNEMWELVCSEEEQIDKSKENKTNSSDSNDIPF